MNPAPAAALPASPQFRALEAVRLLRSAGGALLGQAVLHAQLAGVEWQAEKRRLLKMLAIGLLGFACLLCALLFAGALVLALSWATAWRVPALAGLVLLFGAGSLLAARRFAVWSALGAQAFAGTRAELALDAALLKAHL
jgi:uncharacterized membrane protein YqjE